MRGGECTCLFFRVLGGRLVVFDRVAKRAVAGLQNGNIEGMVGVRVGVQRNRGAVGSGRAWATISRQRSAGVQSSCSPARIRVGAINVTNGRRQAG